MTPEIFRSLADTSKGDSLPLRQLHAAARDGGSNWSIDQLHLMLACLGDWEVKDQGNDWIVKRAGLSQEEELEDAIVAAVQSQGGKPMPASVVMSLLPGKFTTSEAQIRKLAKESSSLQVIGPGLIATK
ncbi:MAG: hypothetical protein IT422_22880 [Pirellulaceae bacterium]|nr:hypothetical protein [Pirellulaceae bacterium]